MELGRVSRDSTGFRAMEEVLISSGGRNLSVPLVTPGSSVHGILQARILEWVAIPFSRGFKTKQGNRPSCRDQEGRSGPDVVVPGASLYFLSGNAEFSWQTYQSLPAVGFNGIPVALLAVNNPIGVIFSGLFMAMLNIIGTQMTKFTAYNEYITDVIIAAIVYLSAFSLVIRSMLSGKNKKAAVVNDANAISADDAAKDEAARAAVLAKQTEAANQTPADGQDTEKGGAE